MALLGADVPWAPASQTLGDAPVLHDEASGVSVRPGRMLGVVSADPDASAALADRLGYKPLFVAGCLLRTAGFGLLVVADSPVEEEFLWTLRNVGLDHVLLGSDYPQIGLDTTVEAFERLDLTADEKAKIRSGNAMKLFGR